MLPNPALTRSAYKRLRNDKPARVRGARRLRSDRRRGARSPPGTPGGEGPSPAAGARAAERRADLDDPLPRPRRASPSRVRRAAELGGSMGGQETLLLVARYPSLLAGAAAFDAPTNMVLRYHDFSLLRLGYHLQRLMCYKIGGPPQRDAGAYAVRSPLDDARKIAFSGVPLQLWWSTTDRVVADQARESGLLFREIKRINPNAPASASSAGGGTRPRCAPTGGCRSRSSASACCRAPTRARRRRGGRTRGRSCTRRRSARRRAARRRSGAPRPGSGGGGRW